MGGSVSKTQCGDCSGVAVVLPKYRLGSLRTVIGSSSSNISIPGVNLDDAPSVTGATYSSDSVSIHADTTTTTSTSATAATGAITASFTSTSTRMAELRSLAYGDISPSTGRKFTYAGLLGEQGHILVAGTWAAESLAAPRRTMDYVNYMLNSDRWDGVIAQPGDVVVTASFKSGATWLQMIIAHILYRATSTSASSNNNNNLLELITSSGGVTEAFPWVELRQLCPPAPLVLVPVVAYQESSTTSITTTNTTSTTNTTTSTTTSTPTPPTPRRILKSHLPLDGIPFSTSARYIVVGRDLRDVVCSYVNYWRAGNDAFYTYMNSSGTSSSDGSSSIIGPPLPRFDDCASTSTSNTGNNTNATSSTATRTVRQCFLSLIDPFDEGRSIGMCCSYWHYYDTWFQYRHMPNIHFVHYNNLKTDFKDEVAKLGLFLNSPLTAHEIDAIKTKTSFKHMKSHADDIIGPKLSALFVDGGRSLFTSGSNDSWAQELTKADVQAYLDYGRKRLGDACFYWLLTGEMV